MHKGHYQRQHVATFHFIEGGVVVLSKNDDCINDRVSEQSHKTFLSTTYFSFNSVCYPVYYIYNTKLYMKYSNKRNIILNRISFTMYILHTWDHCSVYCKTIILSWPSWNKQRKQRRRKCLLSSRCKEKWHTIRH